MAFVRVAVDGFPASQWIVLDYMQVIVHIFHREKRAFYSLEDLWGDAPRLRGRRCVGVGSGKPLLLIASPGLMPLTSAVSVMPSDWNLASSAGVGAAGFASGCFDRQQFDFEDQSLIRPDILSRAAFAIGESMQE